MLNTEITERQVMKMALEYMRSQGLQGWDFKFTTAKRRLGACWDGHARRRGQYVYIQRIELSVHILQLGWAQIEDTLKHEVAHALVGPNHSHDAVWAAKAVELGARPDARACVAMQVTYRFHATCGTCGHVFKRHKRPRHGALSSCTRCGGSRFDPRFVLTWEDNAPPRAERRAARRRLRTLRGQA